MKKYALIFMLIFSFCLGNASAQTKKSSKKTASKQAVSKKSVKKESRKAEVKTRNEEPPHDPPRDSFSEWGLGAITWQEDIEGKRAGEKTKISTHVQGVTIDYTKNYRWIGGWRTLYMGQFAVGTISGEGREGGFPDKLKNQIWLAGTVGVGTAIRTTKVSDLGFMIPLTYRTIQWNVEAGSGLEMDRENSFSYGASAIYINRITEQWFMRILITHQQEWAATTWAISSQYGF